MVLIRGRAAVRIEAQFGATAEETFFDGDGALACIGDGLQCFPAVQIPSGKAVTEEMPGFTRVLWRPEVGIELLD